MMLKKKYLREWLKTSVPKDVLTKWFSFAYVVIVTSANHPEFTWAKKEEMLTKEGAKDLRKGGADLPDPFLLSKTALKELLMSRLRSGYYPKAIVSTGQEYEHFVITEEDFRANWAALRKSPTLECPILPPVLPAFAPPQ